MLYLCKLADILWDPTLLILFTAVGGYFTLRSGCFQLRVVTWVRGLFAGGKKPAKKAGLSRRQALCTALASTVGTGSVAGVATAVFLGGPGAVFWMWVSAFLGMMTGFAEKALAVRYRERTPGGASQGGPMCYMEHGLCKPLGKALAVLFCLACVPASLAGGALVQSNSVAAALRAAFGVPLWAAGLCTAALAGAVILGGVGRVGRLSEKLVPAMGLLYLGAGITCLVVHREALGPAFHAIFDGAFRPRAAFGGWSVSLALRYGVARGVFTNEAGLGSSAMAHAAADTDSPGREGLWGMAEVFLSTLLVCTVTALVLLTSGAFSPDLAWAAIRAGAVTDDLLGAPLTARAFSAGIGPAGPILLAVCLTLFAFTSILGWSYYGQRGLVWLTGSERPVPAFRGVFLLCVALGAVGDASQVWQLADLFNALMALPNLTALVLLAPQALAILDNLLYSKRS